MAGVFGIGITGLNAAQAGLQTAEHNIANAGTAGYHRQEIIQKPALPLGTGSGFFGQGTQVETVRRIYSEFLDKQLMQVQTGSSYLDTFNAQIGQIDNMLADPSTGLSPALQNLFGAVQAVQNTPSSLPARQSLLSNASSLVSRFTSLNQRLTDLRSGVNSQLSGMVSEINSYAAQIAELNNQIGVSQSVSGGAQQPNDLLDQRDQIISDLNKLANVSVLKQSDGSYNIFIGSGQPLVVGAQKFNLSLTQSKEDPDNLVLGYASGELKSSLLSGGSISALLAFRDTSLDPAQNELGRVAAALAQTFNDQHKLGMDLNGALGTNFFNVGSKSPTVTPNAGNNAATTVSISAALSSVGALTVDNYRITCLTAGAPPTYSVTNLTTNTTNTYTTAQMNAANTPVPGLTLTVSAGTINAGDQWLVLPTRYAARDISVAITNPSDIAAAVPIRTNSNLSNIGTGTISAGTVNAPPPTNANLLQPVTITFASATTFDVAGIGTGNPAGVAYTPGGNITYNGWTVQISGAPHAGDVFTIQSNSGGISDGRNALALGLLQTTNTMANNSSGTPTTTFQGAYGQMVSDVGNKTREMEVRSKAQASLVAQTKQDQQGLSGVNLDEEAANLIRYQQAYQASGKAMQIASSLFATLLDLGK